MRELRPYPLPYKNMFCKHKFKKENNILHCELCGKIIYIKCFHKWKIHKESAIITAYRKKQILQILICELCGDIKKLNITTGELN